MNLNPYFDPESIKLLNKAIGYEIHNGDVIFIDANVNFNSALGEVRKRTVSVAMISGYEAETDRILAHLNDQPISVLRDNVKIGLKADSRQVPWVKEIWHFDGKRR